MGRRILWLERQGRRFLWRLLAALFGVRPRPLPAPDGWPPRPAILVVRLDPRVGNVILLTPLLQSLRLRFPNAALDVVVDGAGVPLLSGLQAVDGVRPFDKRRPFGRHGFVRQVLALRARRYDLAIDAANPTGPSLTHAALTRWAGARHTIGSDWMGSGRLYSAPVAAAGPDAPEHEVDRRLALLGPLGPGPLCRTPRIAPALPLPEGSPLPAFFGEACVEPFVLINVGARLESKRLRAADYAVIANAVTVAGLVPLLSFGPSEAALAREAAGFSAQALLAPPTNLAELAWLMGRALCVISCDTGPMHLAVALGRPTCALFVSTDPARYGPRGPAHAVVDARNLGHADWLGAMRAFIQRQRACALPSPRAPTPWPEEVTPLDLGAASGARPWAPRPQTLGRPQSSENPPGLP